MTLDILAGWKTVIVNTIVLTASFIVILTPLAPFFTWSAVCLAILSSVNLGLRYLTTTPIFIGETSSIEDYLGPVTSEEVTEALEELTEELK